MLYRIAHRKLIQSMFVCDEEKNRACTKMMIIIDIKTASILILCEAQSYTNPQKVEKHPAATPFSSSLSRLSQREQCFKQNCIQAIIAPNFIIIVIIWVKQRHTHTHTQTNVLCTHPNILYVTYASILIFSPHFLSVSPSSCVPRLCLYDTKQYTDSIIDNHHRHH